MFKKIDHTAYAPAQPILVWDGNCGFCKYWVTRWERMTGDKIIYRTFQEAADDFKDFPLKEFKKASRLIESDGKIYSGPDSAYRCYDHTNNKYPFHKWYQHNKTFTWLSDHGYNWIAKHRPFMFKLTHICFGKNPTSLKPYWLFYAIAIGIIIYLALNSA